MIIRASILALALLFMGTNFVAVANTPISVKRETLALSGTYSKDGQKVKFVTASFILTAKTSRQNVRVRIDGKFAPLNSLQSPSAFFAATLPKCFVLKSGRSYSVTVAIKGHGTRSYRVFLHRPSSVNH